MPAGQLMDGTTRPLLSTDGAGGHRVEVVPVTSTGGVAPAVVKSAGGIDVAVLFTADAQADQWGLSTLGLEFAWNGATWDRVRANLAGSLLASAARTATNSSADQTNFNGGGVLVFLDVSLAGTGSITLKIEAKDPVSGNYVALLTGAAVTTVTTNVYTVYPGITVAANVSASEPLPRTWRVTVTHNNANTITYSVGYCVME